MSNTSVSMLAAYILLFGVGMFVSIVVPPNLAQLVSLFSYL